jgi:hypothetical protein
MVGGAVAVLALVAGLASCENRFGATLVRPEDPVVLTGDQLPELIGHDPTHIVAFAWDGTAWQQIPVQVDQRDLVNPGRIYHRPSNRWAKRPDGNPFEMLVYTPPPASTGYRSYATYTPPDRDPDLDADDEVALLAADVGQLAPGSAGNPANVDPSTEERLTVGDPRDPEAVGYVYLYSSASRLGGAVTSGVDYRFSLDSGNYRKTYRMGTASIAPNNLLGPNPEHSTITTSRYRVAYADRWLNDGLVVRDSGSNGQDLLDRAQYPVPNFGCVRNEDTYDLRASTSPYEAAFIANISGPVRAIRSHIGANSFTYTTQSELFYPQRTDSVIHLLGHAGLPGYGSYDDFTTGLAGMTYSDNQNTKVPIDGVADTVTPITWTVGSGTPPDVWQLVKGPAGSIVTARTLDTSVTGARVSSWYDDKSPDSPTPCTGDTSSWGQNGFQILAPSGSGGFPNTDPTIEDDPPTLTATRTRYLLGPSTGATRASELADRVFRPVTVAVAH